MKKAAVVKDDVKPWEKQKASVMLQEHGAALRLRGYVP